MIKKYETVFGELSSVWPEGSDEQAGGQTAQDTAAEKQPADQIRRSVAVAPEGNASSTLETAEQVPDSSADKGARNLRSGTEDTLRGQSAGKPEETGSGTADASPGKTSRNADTSLPVQGAKKTVSDARKPPGNAENPTQAQRSKKPEKDSAGAKDKHSEGRISVKPGSSNKPAAGHAHNKKASAPETAVGSNPPQTAPRDVTPRSTERSAQKAGNSTDDAPVKKQRSQESDNTKPTAETEARARLLKASEDDRRRHKVSVKGKRRAARARTMGGPARPDPDLKAANPLKPDSLQREQRWKSRNKGKKQHRTAVLAGGWFACMGFLVAQQLDSKPTPKEPDSPLAKVVYQAFPEADPQRIDVVSKNELPAFITLHLPSHMIDPGRGIGDPLAALGAEFGRSERTLSGTEMAARIEQVSNNLLPKDIIRCHTYDVGPVSSPPESPRETRTLFLYLNPGC